MAKTERVRTIALIDGPNLYSALRALEREMDFKGLLGYLRKEWDLLRAYYFTAVDESGVVTIRPLLDWLDYNGFTVVTKPTKEYETSSGVRRKGNMIGEIYITVIELIPHVDEVVLFTGDGDFLALTEYLKDRGVRVTVVSTLETDPAFISDDLRRNADRFVELDALPSSVFRESRN